MLFPTMFSKAFFVGVLKCGKELTFYTLIPFFNDPTEDIIEKVENARNRQFLLFVKSTCGERRHSCQNVTLVYVCGCVHLCAFLTLSLIHHFETVPNSKKLQMTTERWLLKDFKIRLHRKHCGKR